MDELLNSDHNQSAAHMKPERPRREDVRQDGTGYKDLEINLVKNRIFINHVDLFNAKHIAAYLTDQAMGSLKRNLEEYGEEQAQTEVLRSTITRNVDKFEVVGTMKNRFGRLSEDIAYTISESDQKIFDAEMLSCGYVIYDITIDPGEIPKALAALNRIIAEIDGVADIGPKTYQKFDRHYLFILLSNVLTWGKTKPLDRDDPEIPFTEADFRKRKASPNYEEQIACEKEVIQKGKKYPEVLRTYVLCCGMPYGFDEDNLFVPFKMAWDNKILPIFIPGNNYIPVIHIEDVAKVIHAIIEIGPKRTYILAVEQLPCKLGNIMRALSKSMGCGVKEIVKEEAFLYCNISQRLYDILTINLKMEPAFIIDELNIRFRNELNLVQNMNQIVEEFRVARHLTPMKVLIHGPIASGRSTLAANMVEFYGLHYVHVRTMIEETREKLKKQINDELEARKTAKVNLKIKDDDDDDEDDDGGYEDDIEWVNLPLLQEQLRELEDTLEKNNNRLPDEHIIRLMKAFLSSNICQNQGYVLDSYPKTIEECKTLFGAELENALHHKANEDLDEELGEDITQYRSFAPQYVISLVASDDFLTDRMMEIPERDTFGTHYEEENMLQTLKVFRENNTEDNTLLNFFDEHEIHPIIINVMTPGYTATAIFEKVNEFLGAPIGFEPTAEEQEELFRCQDMAKKLKAEQDSIEQQILEHEALEEYQRKMEERIRMLDELQIEEEKRITVQCEPLRNYLMVHVFPTLTQGLLEVARLKPEDPVDYLAEYLFKYNPEGKMFDPTYTRRGELIQNDTKNISIKKSKIKKLQEICK